MTTQLLTTDTDRNLAETFIDILIDESYLGKFFCEDEFLKILKLSNDFKDFKLLLLNGMDFTYKVESAIRFLKEDNNFIDCFEVAAKLGYETQNLSVTLLAELLDRFDTENEIDCYLHFLENRYEKAKDYMNNL
jgi:hypothetical protein